MSLQWTLVATFLYVEIGFMIIFLLPFISPTRWQKIFRSRLITGLTSYANLYFNVMLVALILLLVDAIREITIYKTRLNSSNDPNHGGLHYGPTMELVKEFRAQRNFYIAGTALFLWFVIKRLLALISQQAQLIAENTAIKQQAESASRAASQFMNASAPSADDSDKKERRKSEVGGGDNNNKAHAELERQLLVKNEELNEVKKSMESAKLNVEAMKRQAKSVSEEYDNLMKEHAKVLDRLEKFERGDGENKKQS